MIDKKLLNTLRRTVWSHYRKHARNDLPWRQTHDPYRILVSEIMLQQTQVARVVEKYTAFLSQFPDVYSLARAPLRDVLIAWQGLGYNRRARMLHQAAQAVVHEYAGIIPTEYQVLRTLPGIGPYTAGAVCAFAYNIPVPIVETNIRTVFFHHLFALRSEVSDSELLDVSAALLDHKKPRAWYYALMDYGAYLKAQRVHVNDKSKHYTKQSTFEGSDRQIRGAIVRTLTTTSACTEKKLIVTLRYVPARVRAQLRALERENMIRRVRGRWTI